MPGASEYSPAWMRVASPVSRPYQVRMRGWRSKPRSASPSLTRQSGVPLGTSRNTCGASISSGEFRTRHANDTETPAASRTRANAAPAAMSHLRIRRDSEQLDQLAGLRADGERSAVELAHRLDPEHGVRHEHLVGFGEIGRQEVRLARGETDLPGVLEHDASHHAANAA